MKSLKKIVKNERTLEFVLKMFSLNDSVHSYGLRPRYDLHIACAFKSSTKE